MSVRPIDIDQGRWFRPEDCDVGFEDRGIRPQGLVSGMD